MECVKEIDEKLGYRNNLIKFQLAAKKPATRRAIARAWRGDINGVKASFNLLGLHYKLAARKRRITLDPVKYTRCRRRLRRK